MKWAAIATLGCAALCGAAAAQPLCSATAATTVVELYTSEGCSSCPPADRWLSTLKGRDGVLALAFHVNYWDRLGWVDRFASPEITARQYALANAAGSTSVYTPQVVVNGRDARAGASLPALPPSTLGLRLARDGANVTVQVDPSPGGPARLRGYWAVLEDAHESKVRAGENAGETLRHDHVVRLYQPVPIWTAADGLRTQLAVSPGVPRHPRRVAFVVADPATQRPLQAAVLGC